MIAEDEGITAESGGGGAVALLETKNARIAALEGALIKLMQACADYAVMSEDLAAAWRHGEHVLLNHPKGGPTPAQGEPSYPTLTLRVEAQMMNPPKPTGFGVRDGETIVGFTSIEEVHKALAHYEELHAAYSQFRTSMEKGS